MENFKLQDNGHIHPDMDYKTASYNYDLPRDSIAQHPGQGDSRLLVVERQRDEGPQKSMFSELEKFLPQGSLLIANNSRVVPARIRSFRKTGGKQEFLLLSPLPLVIRNSVPLNDGFMAEAECLLKPSSKFKAGEIFNICPDLRGKIISKGAYGIASVELYWKGNLEEIFNIHGALPLPPYIGRDTLEEDKKDYQTQYASVSGSVAAPTAGLHFSMDQIGNLQSKGFYWEEITLHVSYGTFNPVRCDDIREHRMHSEYVEISEKTASAINTAIRDKRPVIAIGTTSLRAIEGAFLQCGRMKAFNDWINIFIYPGFKFNIVSGLVTNFHLPESTLLMLVSAFAGREKILDCYKYAIKEGFKFFSYGDAMLIR